MHLEVVCSQALWRLQTLERPGQPHTETRESLLALNVSFPF